MKKYILLLLLMFILLTGCGKPTPQEIQQMKRKECFSNSDLVNCDRIDFISYKDNERVRFSCRCDKKDFNTIYYKKYDFYEMVDRIYSDISMYSEHYILDEVELSEKDITENGKSHYVQVKLEKPISINLDDETQENISKLLYDAESGNFWLGDESELYTVIGKWNNQEEDFLIDKQMISYIEGKAESQEYSTFIEEIYYKSKK